MTTDELLTEIESENFLGMVSRDLAQRLARIVRAADEMDRAGRSYNMQHTGNCKPWRETGCTCGLEAMMAAMNDFRIARDGG